MGKSRCPSRRWRASMLMLLVPLPPKNIRNTCNVVCPKRTWKHLKLAHSTRPWRGEHWHPSRASSGMRIWVACSCPWSSHLAWRRCWYHGERELYGDMDKVAHLKLEGRRTSRWTRWDIALPVSQKNDGMWFPWCTFHSNFDSFSIFTKWWTFTMVKCKWPAMFLHYFVNSCHGMS